MSTHRCQRVRIVETGWDTDLAVEMGPDEPPVPEGDEVVVAIEACGVCFRDLIDREGRIPFIQTPVVPGHEGVGHVIAVGPDVRDFAVGDRVASMHRNACGQCRACRSGNTSLCESAAFVLGLMADGAYARFLRVPESGLFRVPVELPAPEAAVLHCTFGTAWRSMVTVGGLTEGERVVVTGANGGVGSAAVQIAARFASEVVAVVRSEGHEDFLRQLGATRVLVSPDLAFHREPGMGGFDLVIDNVGSPTFNASLRSLGVGGRLCAVGNVVPDRTDLNVGLVIVMGLKILGAGGATRSDMEALLAEHARRPFEVAIDRTLPLSRADAAQRLVKAGGLEGRVVVVPD